MTTGWTKEELGILYDQALRLAADMILPYPAMCRECFIIGKLGWCNHEKNSSESGGKK